MALMEVLHGLGTSQTLVTVASITLGIFAAYLYLNHSPPGNAPPLVKGDLPGIGPVKFWTRRWDFFQEAAKQSTHGHFSFHVGRNNVVGLTGDEGRRVFIESKQLDMGAGYAALFAGSPNASTSQEFGQQELDAQPFVKRLTGMMKRENFAKGLPFLISDTRSRLDELAKDPKGVTDPFESIYEIVYQLTMRTVACNEIANDRVMLSQTLDMFEKVEAAASPKLIIFPWFPFPGKLQRLWYGGKLYIVFKKIIDSRAKTGRREEDPLQYLIDLGDNVEEILTFVVGALYAGQLNSGINAAWVVIYLAHDKYWRAKVYEEVKSMAKKYNADESKPLAERLATIPLDAWESELPTIDMCLRDSIRLNAPGSMFRKNNSDRAVKLSNGIEIPSGAFAAYPIADVHLDPEVYPDPLRWDPSRYLPEKAEDQKKKLAFLGWGAGRHPCLGMRFAKLEQNIILAFFIAYFDFELVDKDGKPCAEVPHDNVNDFAAAKPKERVYVKYTARE